jgi:hypothetical protein
MHSLSEIIHALILTDKDGEIILNDSINAPLSIEMSSPNLYEVTGSQWYCDEGDDYSHYERVPCVVYIGVDEVEKSLK